MAQIDPDVTVVADYASADYAGYQFDPDLWDVVWAVGSPSVQALDFGYRFVGGDLFEIAFLFAPVPMAHGVVIESATLTLPTAVSVLDCPSCSNDTTPFDTVSIECGDIDSAAPWLTEADYTSRNRSAAVVTQATVLESGTGPDGEELRTISYDVTGLVQDVINRPGWTEDSRISFFMHTEDSEAEWGGLEGFYDTDVVLAVWLTAAHNSPLQSGGPFGLTVAASGTLHSMATMVVPGHTTSALAFSGAFNSNPFPPMNVGVSLLGAKSGVEFDTGGVHNIYLCYLTGYQNGLDELLVPMSSFQCSLRVDDPSYLQVVTPTVEYADEIAARTDGEIRVVMCQVKNGEIINQEQIARVSMDYVSVDEGTSNKSVTLSGHSDPEGAAQKTVTLENSTYKRLVDGTTTLRFPEPNIYLRPGDTVVSGPDQIKAEKITLYMSVSRQQMEVSGG